MMILLFILTFTQGLQTPEQKALDYFQDNIYLNSEIYKCTCEDDDPDCICLGSILPDKFVGDKFLENYTLYVKPEIEQYPSNNSSPHPDYIQFYGQVLFDRKMRIAEAVNDQMNLSENIQNKVTQPISNIELRSPFKSSLEYKTDDNNSIYLEVSKAIFTGEEYYVEIDLFTNYTGMFDYDDGFGYQFIFDKNMSLVDWTTTY